MIPGTARTLGIFNNPRPHGPHAGDHAPERRKRKADEFESLVTAQMKLCGGMLPPALFAEMALSSNLMLAAEEWRQMLERVLRSMRDTLSWGRMGECRLQRGGRLRAVADSSNLNKFLQWFFESLVGGVDRRGGGSLTEHCYLEDCTADPWRLYCFALCTTSLEEIQQSLEIRFRTPSLEIQKCWGRERADSEEMLGIRNQWDVEEVLGGVGCGRGSRWSGIWMWRCSVGGVKMEVLGEGLIR